MEFIMPGNKQTAETNKKKYGDKYYSEIGEKGGRAKTDKLKGFAYMKKHHPRS